MFEKQHTLLSLLMLLLMLYQFWIDALCEYPQTFFFLSKPVFIKYYNIKVQMLLNSKIKFIRQWLPLNGV